MSTLERLLAPVRFQPALTWTVDSQHVLASTPGTGGSDLWAFPALGGQPSRVARLEGRTVRGIATHPDGRAIAVAADQQGTELAQLMLIDLASGQARPLTDQPASQHLLGPDAWSMGGRWLAYAANAQDPGRVEVFVHDLDGGRSRAVFGTTSPALPAGWSSDSRLLAVSTEHAADDTDVHVVNVVDGTSRLLTGHDGPALSRPGPWGTDGTGLWVLTDEDREHVGLAWLGLDGARRWVDTPDGDIEAVAGDLAGRVLVWAVNDRGWTRLHARDLTTGTPLPEPQLPDGCLNPHRGGLAVSPDGRRAAVIWGQPTRSNEVHVIELATGHTTRISDTMAAGPDPDSLITPQLITYPAGNGPVPAWWYPATPTSTRHAAAVAVHGGPQAQERPEYRPLFQYLAAHGISVLAPNIRGSTGYGKTYTAQINRAWGTTDLDDLAHAADWLTQHPHVNPDRIGIIGGSYGGFAALSCLARQPHRWTAGVSICGPSNLATFAAANPPQWMPVVRRTIGDPDHDAHDMQQRSPMTHIDTLTAPLLVLQGANDPRVPRAESDQLVTQLRQRGRDVHYVVFDNEGHGFTDPDNERHAHQLTADWLTAHLT